MTLLPLGTVRQHGHHRVKMRHRQGELILLCCQHSENLLPADMILKDFAAVGNHPGLRQASPDLANSYDHGGTAPLWRGAELKLFNGRAKRPPNYSRI